MRSVLGGGSGLQVSRRRRLVPEHVPPPDPDPNAPLESAHKVLDNMGAPPKNQEQRRATYLRRARLHRRLLLIEARAKALGLVD